MANAKRKVTLTTKNTTKKPISDHNYDLEILFEYLKSRAESEKNSWELTINFFEENFKKGCRSFFGVEVNNLGFPLWDTQEPHLGFLNNFLCWYFLSAA
jgi:hypothetical protein